MTKAIFITALVARRQKHYRSEIEAGRMRPSEAVMGMADAEKDAARLWRKHRKDYVRMEAGDVFK
jgi:hypothetical protein